MSSYFLRIIHKRAIIRSVQLWDNMPDVFSGLFLWSLPWLAYKDFNQFLNSGLYLDWSRRLHWWHASANGRKSAGLFEFVCISCRAVRSTKRLFKRVVCFSRCAIVNVTRLCHNSYLFSVSAKSGAATGTVSNLIDSFGGVQPTWSALGYRAGNGRASSGGSVAMERSQHARQASYSHPWSNGSWALL